jgi:shikimate kinase
MGTGKTLVGKNLSKDLNIPFIDLDEHIEDRHNKKIFELFNEKGEVYFRKLEIKHLEELLRSNENMVLSLGGGTPCYGENMNIIKQNLKFTSIYLKGSVSLLTDRLFMEKNTRPIISHIKTKHILKQFIAKHLFDRLPFYQLADKIIEIDDKNVSIIIEEIKKT